MRWGSLAVFVLAIGMVACSRSNSPLRDPSGIEKERLADDIMRKVATKLKEEKGLIPIGTIGQMLNEIQKLGLSFYYYKPIDIAEGRKLLIDSVNAMLNDINQDTRIHSFLIRNPFRPRNIEIEIFLWNPDRREVTLGALNVITACDGNLCYKIKHPDRIGNLIIYRETYEEALERIANPSLPLVPFQPDPEVSPEKLAELRKGISFIGDDGLIWRLGDDGCWVRDAK